MRMPGGLVPVFVCGAVVGAVEPSVVASRFAPCSAPPKMGVTRPCIEGRGEDDGGYGKGLCGDAEDEDDSEGIHGDVFSFFVNVLSNLVRSTAASERTKSASGPRRSCSAGVAPPGSGRVQNPRMRKRAGRLVQGGDAVCPCFYFCKNGIRFIGADSEVFSGEGEVVEFSGGVVDSEADVPVVFCGVAVCGCAGAQRLSFGFCWVVHPAR